jgi:lysophospholipase-2
MGGALALYTGLTFPSQIGGIVALSCWLPMHKSFPYGGPIQHPAVLQCHGESDPLVVYPLGLMTSTLLKPHLPKYTFKSYPNLQHSSNEQELEDVKNFIKEVLPNLVS